MCIILGNALENAIEACQRMSRNGQFINLHIKMIANMLIVTLDNSYSGVVELSDAFFVSSKRSGVKKESVWSVFNPS